MAANQRMEIHRKRNLTPARNVGIYTTDMKAFCMRKSANDYLTVTKRGFDRIFLVIWKWIYYNKRQRDGEKRDRRLPEMKNARMLRRTVKRKQAVCENGDLPQGG